MLTEFGGRPVAGGTLPAQIWKTFMTAAPTQQQGSTRAVRPDAVPPGAGAADRLAGRLVQARQRLLPRARASSRTSRAAGRPPQAECYANEVTVPLVVGMTVDAANARLA